MANITLWGASYTDVPSVLLPKTGGGTEEFFWGDANLSWLGKNVEVVNGSLYSKDYTLNNTDFKTWEPSTTAATIIASETLSPTVTLDLVNYEYALRWKFEFLPTYDGTQTNKARVVKCVADQWQVIQKRANSLANISAENPVGNSCVTLTSAAILEYYNSSSSHTYTWSASYGVYPALVAATFSNSTSDTPKLTIKAPSVSARCSTTYLSTANAGKIVQASSSVKIRGYLYRYKRGGIMYNEYLNLCNLYANPL